jgi:hypothetical protein
MLNCPFAKPESDVGEMGDNEVVFDRFFYSQYSDPTSPNDAARRDAVVGLVGL